MAKNTEKQGTLESVPVDKLTAELRRRGLAVCVFQPADMKGRPGTSRWTAPRRADWLREHASNIEDIMVERGDEAIDDFLFVK